MTALVKEKMYVIRLHAWPKFGELRNIVLVVEWTSKWTLASTNK